MSDIKIKVNKKRMKMNLEFKEKKIGEPELFVALNTFSNPQGIIIDILLGKLPLSILNLNQDCNKSEVKLNEPK